MSFEETILLRLKRKYRNDEEVAFILNELSKARVRNGELLSEFSEANDRICAMKKEIDGLKSKIASTYETAETAFKAEEKRNHLAHQKEITSKDKKIRALSKTVENLIQAKKLKLTYEERVKEGLRELEQRNKALINNNMKLGNEVVQWRNKYLDLMAKNHTETIKKSNQ